MTRGTTARSPVTGQMHGKAQARGSVARRPVLPRPALGMTLIELMVGLAVGLFVSLIAIAVFVSTRTLNVVNNSSARLGENARLAMEALQEDLRHAGFQGCHDLLAVPPASVLNGGAAATAGFLDTGTGVAGHRGTGTAFAPVLGAALAGLTPAPNTNSDILSVRVPVDNLSLALTAVMATAADPPQVGAAGAAVGTLRVGDIALVASCKAAAIFQITADPATAGSLAHAVNAAFTPGNAVANLPQRFGKDAAVYKLETRHYYVAPSTLHAGTNALWRFRVPCAGCTGTDNPQELAAGVDRLNILWGVDTDGDETVNRYLAADAVPAWEQVVSARVQMLVATSKDNVTQSAQTVTFAGSSVTPTDRRLRTVLTEVVALRNRAP